VTNNGGVSATSLGGSGLSAPFTYKGGTFPGTGGNCSNGGSLAVATPCNVVVLYDPTADGDFSSTLQVDFHDGISTTNSTIVVEGETEAILVISESPTYNYGNVTVTDVKEKTFTVQNTGYADATAVTPAAFALSDYAWQGA